MIAVVVFVAVFASAAGQQACNELLPKNMVNTDLGNFVSIYQGNTEVPVYYSCITLSSNQSGFVAITAYVEGYLLDYRCMGDGWEPTDTPKNVTGIFMTDRDIEPGKCSDCLTKSRGLSAGHCQGCSDGCGTCGIRGICFSCEAGYYLSSTSCVESPTPAGLTTDLLVVVIVCSVLGVVFIVLAVAAVALVVYIFTFTRTETIAHRRLRTENQPVSYRRKQNIGTHRHNPMFGVSEGWGNPTFTESPEGGWTNPLAPRRPPLHSIQIANSKEEVGDIDDRQVETVIGPEGAVEYDEYDDY